MPKKIFPRPSFARYFILSSISMLLFCLGFFMAPMGIALLLFSPTPMALLGVRENKAWMTLGLLGITFTLWLVFGWGIALSYLLGYGLLCFGLTLPLGKLEKGSESLLICIMVSIISKVLFMAVSVALGGTNPFMADENTLRHTLYHIYGGTLSRGGQEAAQLLQTMEQMLAFIPYMLPFFIIIYSMFDSFLNYRLCEVLQRKREVTFPPLPPFGEWRFPRSFLYVFVFAFALPFIVDGNDWRLWVMMEYNLKYILNVFFFLQGLALIWWWLSKHAARYFPSLLRIALIVVFAMPILNTWVGALGFCDLCFDLRNRKIKRA